MTDKYPVIYRMEGKRSDRSAVAFFPHEHVNHGRIGCYAHLGQHGEADLGYYGTTSPVRTTNDVAAVAALRAELKQIYETGDDAVELVERKRLPVDWRATAWR